MLGYILKRLLLAVPTLFAVLTIVFVLVRVLPGDPAQMILGDQASAEALANMRHRLGLDKPIGVQYVDFLVNAVRGDWGISMVTGKPVIDEVRVLPYTHRPHRDGDRARHAARRPARRLGGAAPQQLGRLRVRMARCSGCRFPASSRHPAAARLRHPAALVSGDQRRDRSTIRSTGCATLALPAVNLGLIMAAYVTRVTRSAMLEVLGEDYIRTARAKGVPSRAVVWRHALRNGLIPVVTVVGLYLGILIGNSVLTEIVFNRPGLGKLIVGALNQRDYTMLQGLMVIYAFADRGW